MLCSSGSSTMPCCSNSQSAKLICGFVDLGTFQSSAFFEALSRSPSKLGHFAMRPGTAVPAEHARCPNNDVPAEQLLGNIEGKASSLVATVEDITGMLSPPKASGAILANTRTAAQTERAKDGGPQLSGLLLQPDLHVSKGFGFWLGFGRHAVCMPQHIHTCQGKNIKTHKTLLGKSLASLISCEDLSFAPETS